MVGVALPQTLVHEVNIEEDQAGGQAVDVEMVDAGVETWKYSACCITPKVKQSPLEGLWRRRQRRVYGLGAAFISPNDTGTNRRFLVFDGAPDNIVILEFEPAVVCVVTTDMRIDCGRHHRDVTHTRNTPRHDHQTG